MRRIFDPTYYPFDITAIADAQRQLDAAIFLREASVRQSGTGTASRGQPATAAPASDDASASGLPANYQPVESAWNIPGPTALVDVYTAAPNTTGTLVVDDPNHVLAALDTPGDKDWFKVTLTEGQTYEFGQYARAGGLPGAEGNGVPLADAYLEIYDSNGNLLSIADGGGPNTPQGLDALMTFQAPYTGTFYVNATSYDNTGDGVGDFAGDYEIFARTATGTVYTTHYDISSPLHSIDWGGVMVNREHVAVRNPDGNEGPRTTNEPAANPLTVEGNTLGFPGKNVIYLYFGGEGDLYANADSTIPGQVTVQDPYQYEIRAMLAAANEFSKVADVVFVSNYTLNTSTGLYERDTSIEYKPGPLGPQAGIKYATGVEGDGFDADFFYFSYPGTPGPGISLLGSMSPPDYGDEGVAQFNSADERWNAQMLQPGGFSFVTLIHEFGHGMGLAHPHDTGGGSSVMQGVVTNGVPGDDGGAGAFDLNQGVYTMMSYNDGWERSPYGQPETTNEGYGWLSSLMALDIAVIQDKYGVNEEWATGNDTYVLKDVNEWGVYIDSATGQPAQHNATNQTTSRDGYYVGQSTSYSSIWDAGGVDQIVYNGSKDTTIDLRAATLRYEYGGAGRMSYATGIFGGFTIANGVTIENATSGEGNDTLVGNSVNNVLTGNGGNDAFYLDAGGDDTALGGAGNDGFYYGAAMSLLDSVDGGDGDDDQAVIQGNYGTSTTGFQMGSSNLINIEKLVVLSGTDTRFGDAAAGITTRYDYNLIMDDGNIGSGKTLVVNANGLLVGEDLYLDASRETNGVLNVYAGQGNDRLIGGAQNDGFFFGNSGNFSAADQIDGGLGSDDQVALRGNYGAIVFNNSTVTNVETIALLSATNTRFASGGTAFNYDLTLADGNHVTGTMTVTGNTLQANETMRVNAAAETTGYLRLIGGAGNDTLIGGQAGNQLFGGLGADDLTAGNGVDTFVYRAAAQSTGSNFDQIFGFNANQDKIDFLGEVGAYSDTALGTLNESSFDATLTSGLANVLGAGEWALFDATGGDMNGRRFLIVDANGVDGYQSGEDYVIELVNSTGDLPTAPDFFI